MEFILDPGLASLGGDTSTIVGSGGGGGSGGDGLLLRLRKDGPNDRP